ncbi:MAG: 23S rRNA (pseudouridine(1915)-N(3))-methyltransferase RlmH [Candidatus Melainabacteria bacterium GWF2_37_15]|nr:MAG: 23S rRNA (pseudouridine(1915)-N(3))-methyltransferase RlmH [Candidatus Melainabacteria bacterium GWF2_37_15]
MNINIITVGKIREKYLKCGVDEYLKRTTPYSSVKITEVASDDKILNQIKAGSFIIVLEVTGKSLSSEEFAAQIKVIESQGINQLVFIIGGAEGLSDEIKQKADLLLSFSDMTFPHQLMRLILVEQIYRAFKILKNEPYHK